MLNTLEQLPVVPLRGLVILPSEALHFDAGRAKTVAALQAALSSNSLVFLTSQREPKKNDIEYDDIYLYGTVCKLRQILRIPGDSVRVLAEGIVRGKIESFISSEPCFEANITRITDEACDFATAEALRRRVAEGFREYAALSGKFSNEVILNIEETEDAGEFSDAVAAHVVRKLEDKQALIESADPIERLTITSEIITKELEILRIDKKIAAQVHKQVDKNQKDYYLREQIRAIRGELGDNDGSEIDEYREQMEAKQLPEYAKKKLAKEIDRLKDLPSGSHEGPVARNYIECMLDLPWNEVTADNTDIKNAEEVLNADHYGMEKVKRRVLESLAVSTLTGDVSGQILCFVGPPGVGKTSICASIAKSLGRKFVRMSLGGVRDEAEIRGHRRTYIGAMPGRVISAMRQAGTINPLLLFDEIDKLSSDSRGDPSSAMLEVLDSAQNHEFRDHFLEVPYDLSKVLFVTTANSKESIPRPLLDRMEIIDVEGYLENDKTQIAMRHLVRKQMEKHGLKKGMLSLNESQIRTIINGYTAEAGVRELERCIASICRKAACEIVEGKARVRMGRQKLTEYLGQPKYHHELAAEKPQVGQVNGLAWTAAGGELLVVEAVCVNGTGQLQLTGNLGDVMQESAKAALTFVRAHADKYCIEPDFFAKHDIHVHVPHGATPKDGPSAGITMVTAMMSACANIPVRSGIAMTGEVTLTGKVLAIGGLREKLLAALRAGVNTVILPSDNKSDVEQVQQSVRDSIKFIYVDNVSTVLKNALQPDVLDVLIPQVDIKRVSSVGAVQ